MLSITFYLLLCLSNLLILTFYLLSLISYNESEISELWKFWNVKKKETGKAKGRNFQISNEFCAVLSHSCTKSFASHEYCSYPVMLCVSKLSFTGPFHLSPIHHWYHNEAIHGVCHFFTLVHYRWVRWTSNSNLSSITKCDQNNMSLTIENLVALKELSMSINSMNRPQVTRLWLTS